MGLRAAQRAQDGAAGERVRAGAASERQRRTRRAQAQAAGGERRRRSCSMGQWAGVLDGLYGLARHDPATFMLWLGRWLSP